MVVGRRDISPAAAGQSPEQARSSNKLGQRCIWSRAKDIPQEYQGESGTGSNGNEDLEYGALWISIANCCGNRGKPFIRVAVVLVLDDLVEMQFQPDHERTDESKRREQSMRIRDPFAIKLIPVRQSTLLT